MDEVATTIWLPKNTPKPVPLDGLERTEICELLTRNVLELDKVIEGPIARSVHSILPVHFICTLATVKVLPVIATDLSARATPAPEYDAGVSSALLPVTVKVVVVIKNVLPLGYLD